MLFYVVELSKYINVVLMLMYVLECTVYFFKMKNPYDCKGISIRQRIIIVLINLVSYLTMTLRTGHFDYMFYGLFVLMFIFFVLSVTNLIYTKVDKILLNNMSILLSTGFIILCRLDTGKAIKQFVIAIISIIIAMIIPWLLKNLSYLKDIKYIYAVCGIAPLLVVLLLGQVTHGSKISYTLAGVTIQPSEFVKIVFVFCMAAFLAKAKNFVDYCMSAVIAAIHVMILVISKDLGSALIFFIAYIIMLFIASKNYIYLFSSIGAGVIASMVAYRLFSHVQVRVQAFLDPFADIDRQGYQISQSLFAISCGSLFGTGLMKGAPSDIPYVESDFIFSAVSEEMGNVFSVCLLLVCLSCFTIAIRNSLMEADKFKRDIIVGLSSLYIFQVFLTVGGGIKFIPLTGVTLPFVSYGGSSIMTSILMFYIIEGYISERKEAEYDEWLDKLEDDDDDSFDAFLEYIDWKYDKKRLKKKNGRKKTARKVESYIVMASFIMLYLSMCSYLLIYVKNNEQELINNSYNSRQALLAQENTRGSIYDSNGHVLAQTLTDENGREYRNYPYENLFSHVIGFSTKGRTGIEAEGNYYLINSNVSLTSKVENDVTGAKNPGNNIYTTLDYDLQDICYRSLSAYRGAIVVSDVKTGNILAMVSKPDFDPNTIVQNWEKYCADTESGVLLNRATQGLYPPGSTFKILTALEYIREHPTDYNNYSYSCSGRFNKGDINLTCYHSTVHGSENFLTSFANSCNSSFANIGIGLDRDKYGAMLNQCMFNAKLPLSCNYTVSNLIVDSSVSDYDMAQIAFGQGKAQITPILLNMITNGIANGGVVMTPRLIDRAESYEGETLKKFDVTPYTSIMSEEESAALTTLMQSVAKQGTAKAMKDCSYNPAVKTGSAEYISSGDESHAWITGFAPAQDPQISVTVIVEGIGSSFDYAVPIAKRIFDVYFDEY